MIRVVVLTGLTCLLAACASNPNSTQHQSASAVAPEHRMLIPDPVLGRPATVSVAEYLEFLDDLDAAVESGDVRPLNRTERARQQQIDRNLREMLASVDHINELSRNEQVDVFNLHEELQAVIIGHPENQVICTRRRPSTGSRVSRTTCITVEEMQYMQRRSEDDLRRLSRIPMEMPTLTEP